MKNTLKFSQNISPYLLKIYKPFFDILFEKYNATTNHDQYSLTAFLISEIVSRIKIIDHLKNVSDETEKKILQLTSSDEKQQLILEFCKELGASEEDLLEDKQAFHRWLDFGTIKERANQKQGKLQNEVYFIILLLPVEDKEPQLTEFLIKFFDSYSGADRIRAAIIKILFQKLKIGENINIDDFNILKNHINLKNNLTIDALELNIEYVNLLSLFSPELFVEHFKQAYEAAYDTNIYSQKEIFFRRAMIASLPNLDYSFYNSLIDIIKKDKSAYVRQGLAEILGKTNYPLREQNLKDLIFSDPDQKVQAKALLVLSENYLSSKGEKNLETLAELLDKITEDSRETLILRLTLKIINNVVMQIDNAKDQEKIIKDFKNITDKIISGEYPVACKNWAKQTNNLIWIAINSLKKFYINLDSELKDLELNSTLQIYDENINDLSEENFGRLLSIIAKDNFDLQFSQKNGIYYVTKGVKKGFRLWRFLHEIFTSNPDKRQNFSHLVGRVYQENNIVMSSIAELSETQVPGEPLFIVEEQNARPFLPLLDSYLYSINKGKQGKIYSEAGITTLTPPASFIGRIYAALSLAFNFKKIANLRNWYKESFLPQNNYVKKLEELDVQTNFKEYDGEKIDISIKNYFMGLAIFPALSSYGVFNYFLTPHEETLAPLLLFILILSTICIVYHRKYFQQQQKNRNKIPLVIGGWGTRGKTGTERLKCAMLSKLGVKIVAKTTGCQPAIVITNSASEAFEMPIIRPHYHATIDEQRSVTLFARNYGADIFLWECMALKDEYVEIMQNQWMIDDISTITNAHPDHEDVQGPSGEDVAKTISTFIRPNGYVITSEQQMLPILKESAKVKGATIESVDWLESELITDDLLEQFPYYEHRTNLALALKLAKVIGIDENAALFTMSKNVVPDIGALKAFVPCTLQNKTLQFINGMSANEELGCLNNWRRLGLENFDQSLNPGTIVSTIVNNRADRGSRSKVFAGLISRDLKSSYHFLIGTNLNGMKSYIEKSWRKYLDDLLANIKQADLENRIKNIFKNLHLCIDEKDKTARISIINDKSSEMHSKEDADKFIKQIEEDFVVYTKLIGSIKNNEISLPEIKEILSSMFLRKIIIIDLNKSSPDDIIKTILNFTPPNYFHKLVGIQNIKNPGLEFVKAWQQWETCFYKIQELQMNDKKIVVQALQAISKFEGFSILSKKYVQNAIANIKDPEIIKDAALYLEEIASDMNKAFSKREYKAISKWNIWENILQEFYNIFKNIENKKLALKIYDDLEKQRISYSRAIKELSKINVD